MLGMIASGIMLSREVFSFFGLRLSAIGRPIHMVSTSWGFLLMSVHLGMYWGMVLGMAGRITRKKQPSKARRRSFATTVIARVLAASVALRGIYAFLTWRMWEKLFLVIQFTFFDYDAPVWLFFIDYIATMGFFACIAHYAAKGFQVAKSSLKMKDKEVGGS